MQKLGNASSGLGKKIILNPFFNDIFLNEPFIPFTISPANIEVNNILYYLILKFRLFYRFDLDM